MDGNELARILTAGVDLDKVAGVFNALGMKAEYSEESVARIDEVVRELCDDAAAAKRAERPRDERKALRDKIELYQTARGVLMGLRGQRAGDVTAVPGTVGSD